MTETTGSQKSRMLAGHLYDASDPELRADRERAALLMHHYNQARPGDPAAGRILADLLGGLGENCELRPPFYCDYGYNIRIGAGCFFNYGCVLLDVCAIEIGRQCQFGPYVQVLTPDHPRDPDLRRRGLERGDPISIGDNVWIGGGVVILPGITIGANAIVAAGAVVTRDVASGAVVGGSPAKPLERRDSEAGPAR